MKGQWKGFFSGVIVTMLVLCLVVPVLADSVRQLNASFSGIKIMLDGQTIEPKDANGSTVEPFAVDGTTYLPLRAVAGALGLGVDWDQANQTAKLTTLGRTDGINITVNGQKIQPKDANGNTVEPFALNGTTYLPVRAVAEALNMNVEWDSSTNTAVLTDKNSQSNENQEIVNSIDIPLQGNHTVSIIQVDEENLPPIVVSIKFSTVDVNRMMYVIAIVTSELTNNGKFNFMISAKDGTNNFVSEYSYGNWDHILFPESFANTVRNENYPEFDSDVRTITTVVKELPF